MTQVTLYQIILKMDRISYVPFCFPHLFVSFLKSGVVLHLLEINYVCFHLFCSGPCQLLQEKGWERFVFVWKLLTEVVIKMSRLFVCHSASFLLLPITWISHIYFALDSQFPMIFKFSTVDTQAYSRPQFTQIRL